MDLVCLDFLLLLHHGKSKEECTDTRNVQAPVRDTINKNKRQNA